MCVYITLAGLFPCCFLLEALFNGSRRLAVHGATAMASAAGVRSRSSQTLETCALLRPQLYYFTRYCEI